MRPDARRVVRIAIAAAIALVTGCRAPAPHEPALPPLNVVLLLADDWRHDTLGAAGHPVVRTPNLDRLAARGVRFTHAYVTTAICGVSRASILTGQWMSRHGCRGFDMFRTPWTETYPGVLRANGDWVGHVGKWHNGAFPAGEYDFGEGRITPTRHWIPQPDGTSMHVTRRNELDAIEFLRTRPADRRFALTVAFFAPHAEDGDPRQYLPQPESLADYRDAEIALPPTATDDAFRALPPFLANERQEGRRRWHWRFDTLERYRESMRNYYRLVSEVDAACGAIVAELERQGELDRTLVIFTTDNGYFHGEHGLADKWYPYQEAIRVPLVVRDPRLAAGRRGTTVDSIALNVDLAPTILAAAGCEVPPGMQGGDLSPLYLDESPTPWRTDFLYEHPTITGVDFIPSSRAVVRRDRKLIEWPDFGVDQLFDLTADPGEVNDLAADPGWAAERAALRRRMVELEAAAR